MDPETEKSSAESSAEEEKRIVEERKWNIGRIFKYKERYQEHPDDDIIYYNCFQAC